MPNERHITINLLPQEPEAWFFIACAAAAIAFFWAMGNVALSNEVEKARIEHSAKPTP